MKSVYVDTQGPGKNLLKDRGAVSCTAFLMALFIKREKS